MVVILRKSDRSRQNGSPNSLRETSSVLPVEAPLRQCSQPWLSAENFEPNLWIKSTSRDINCRLNYAWTSNFTESAEERHYQVPKIENIMLGLEELLILKQKQNENSSPAWETARVVLWSFVPLWIINKPSGSTKPLKEPSRILPASCVSIQRTVGSYTLSVTPFLVLDRWNTCEFHKASTSSNANSARNDR